MIEGVGLRVISCFIWGLIFIVPQFMSGFSPIEIALGRYFFYGIASLLIFLLCAMEEKAALRLGNLD